MADLSGLVWRKSSRSSGEGTDCVEVALPPEAAAVRDSKHRDAMLVMPRASWTRLLAEIR